MTIEQERIHLQQTECNIKTLEETTETREPTLMATVRQELGVVHKSIFIENLWWENSEKLKELERRFSDLEEDERLKQGK